MKKCPKCNHEVIDSVDICPTCGFKFTTNNSKQKKTIKVKAKPKSDQQVTPQSSPATPVNSEPDNKPLTNNRKGLILILGIIGLLLILTLIGSHSKDSNTPSETEISSLSTTTTTTVTTTIAAPAKSETEIYYDTVCNLDIYDVQERKSSMTGTIFHYYKGLPIQTEDEEWLNTSWNTEKSIEAGAIYRSVAAAMEGFELGLNNGSYYSSLVSGKSGLSKEELTPYIANASTFINREDSKNKLLRKLESVSCVQGTFDYESGNFHFVINDTQKCAQEMMISEEMLGYCFGILSEYGAEISFDGTRCTVDRQFG